MPEPDQRDQPAQDEPTVSNEELTAKLDRIKEELKGLAETPNYAVKPKVEALLQSLDEPHDPPAS